MPIIRSFYFVRHGETDWNKQGRVQGKTDIPLNETGIAQARSAMGLVKTLKIDRMVSSHLCRAHETARILNGDLKAPHDVDDLLQERNFGDFEGSGESSFNDLKEAMVEKGLAAEENGLPCPPNAEPYAEFKQRTLTVINRYLEKHEGQNILFVAHGGLYRVLRRCLFGCVEMSPNVQPFLFEKQKEQWILHKLTV